MRLSDEDRYAAEQDEAEEQRKAALCDCPIVTEEEREDNLCVYCHRPIE